MSTKHTPGPWYTTLSSDVFGDGRLLAKVYGFETQGPNARLISQAPGLFDIIHHLAAWMENGLPFDADSRLESGETLEAAVFRLMGNVEGGSK